MSARGVAQRLGRPAEVVPEQRVVLGRQLERVKRGAHVAQPRIPRGDVDRERCMPHAQPGVAAGVGIRGRAAPVLNEEQPQPLSGRAQVVLGVDRGQHRVGGHPGVEGVDEPGERRLAADRFEDGRGVFLRAHPPIVPVMTDVDLIVLGLGPGGEEVAERMAEAGWSVLGVDSHLVGGECPYYGCIPSKMIIRGAELLADARWVNDLAGSADVSPDYGKVYRRIRDEATDDWDDRVAVERLERLGGMFVRGAARFAGRTSDGRLAVEVGDTRYLAPHVVV